VLHQLEKQRGGLPCFVLLDELQVLATGLRDARYSERLIEYLRSVINGEPWLSFAFAARHTFEEQALRHQDKALFGGLRLLHVGLLGTEPAKDVLLNPHPDFRVSFSAEAADRVITLCGGQPYLLQLMGWHLVHRLNEQRARRSKPSDVELADVQAVLETTELWREVAPYGDGALEEIGEAPERLLRRLASLGQGAVLTEELLRGETDQTAVRAALESLEHHDVVCTSAAGQVALRVPLLGLLLERA
jgi:hypothetical protein